MGSIYNGNPVTVERPAKEGDEGFDPAKGEQVIVRDQTGKRSTVSKSEVTESK